MSQLAKNIQAARKAQGLTQQQLAEELRVAIRTIQNWEREIALPHRGNLERLAVALEREPSWFYGSTDGTNGAHADRS